MNLSELDLSVRSFNALKRARIETAEDAMANLYKIITTHKMTARDLLDKLAKRGYLPFDVGHWLSDLDMDDVGEPIPFEDLDKHKGEMAIIDASTSSATAYRAVMLLGTHDDGAFGQYLEYYDGDNRRCYESSFTADKPQIYRIQNTGSRETESKPTVIVSDNYDKAVRLTRHIAANAHAMQESLYEVCKGLKEMRDGKLYKELGYQNFEEYCENEVGITRQQGHRYTTIATMANDENVNSNLHFNQLGVTKLYLLAKLDEPQREEIQQTVNVEETSVRELKQRIKKLETKNAKTEAELEESKARADRLADQVEDLEDQVESLENRPIDVAISVEAEKQVEELKSVLKQTDLAWGRKYTKLEEESIQLRRQDHLEHQHELDALRSEYEQKLADAREFSAPEKMQDHRADFKACLSNAADSMNRMVSFILDHKEDADHAFYQEKALEMLERVRGALL